MMNKSFASRLSAALLAVALFAAAHAAERGGAPLTNSDIIGMTRANASASAIIERIYSSGNNFDLSDRAFMQLKESGVADEVLNAMLAAAKANNAAPAATGALTLPPALGTGGAPFQVPPLGQGGSDAGIAAPPSLSLPPLGGADSPAGQSPFPSSAFTDMPGFDDLPAFGEMPSLPGATGSPAGGAPGGGFSPPPASPPLPVSPVRPVSPAPSAPPAPPPPVRPQSIAPSPSSALPPPAVTPAPSGASSLRPSGAPATPPAPVAAPAPAARPAPSGALDARRFEQELIAVVHGAPDAQRAGLGWMLANRDQTLPVLRQTLDVPRPEYQAAALRVLGAMNDKDSLARMRDMLGNDSPLVRRYAAQALAEMNDAVAITAAERNIESDVNPRDGLIRLVGHARLVRASEALGNVLAGDERPLNRAAAAWALSEIGPAGSVAWPALEKALTGDPDPAVRREAAVAVAVLHAPGSARLLQSACRRDPEVRKVVLAAMADYPEAVEFLVGVVNLGAEQIAPDERETAARSLARLTGQNFFLDGGRWQAWFDENKSRLGQTTRNLADVRGGGSAPSGGGIGRVSAPAPSEPAAPGQMDVSRMGIVLDPAEIPMAPEVEDRFARRPDGPVRAPDLGSLPAYNPDAPMPDALSVDDFAERPETRTPAPGAPAAFAPESGRTASREASTPFSSQWGEGISLERPADASVPAADQAWGGPAPAPTRSAMPAQSVVGQPAGGMASGFGGASAPAETGAGGGLRLALPPMDDDDGPGGAGGMPPTMLGTVAAGAPAPFPIGGGVQGAEPPPGGLTLRVLDSEQAGMESPVYGASAPYLDAPGVVSVLQTNESIPMDAILQDGFSGEVIVPKAGVDAVVIPGGAVAGPVATPAPVPAMTPGPAPVTAPGAGALPTTMAASGAMSIPEPTRIPESADAGEAMETISFPGDTSAFGLGDPLFSDIGGIADYEFDEAKPEPEFEFDSDPDVAMPALPGGGRPAVSAVDDSPALGLPEAMDDEDDFPDIASPEAGSADETGDYLDAGEYSDAGDYLDAGEVFEPYEYPTVDASPPAAPAGTLALPPPAAPAATLALPPPAAIGGEVEAYADDSDALENMEWVRGVGFVKRSGPAASSASSASSAASPGRSISQGRSVESYAAAEPFTAEELEAIQPSTPGEQWYGTTDPSGDYEVLEEGYLTEPPVDGGFITSPSGPPLLGDEPILDVPEDTSGSGDTGKPSRRLRKQR